jgi:hypothetical protein
LALKSILDGGATSNARKAVGADMDSIIAINTRIADEINTQGDVTFASTRNLLIAVAAIGVL